MPNTNQSEYLFPVQKWCPIVKNHFNPAKHGHNRWFARKQDLIDPELQVNDWVFYPVCAEVHFRISAELTNDSSPLLTIKATMGFIPASNFPILPNPEFLEPYQDYMQLDIGPSSSGSMQNYMSSESHLLNFHANHSVEHIRHETHTSGHLDASVALPKHMHAGISAGIHSSQHAQKTHISDFSLESTSRGEKHIHALRLQQYRHNHFAYLYDLRNPDNSIRRYGHAPDYFSEPPTLAKSALWFDAKQTYALNKSDLQSATIPFEASVMHRLVGMSIWRWCANHWFVNTAKINYQFELSLSPQVFISTPAHSPKNCNASFFKAANNKAVDTNTMGPVQSVEYRRNDSIGGINFVPGKMISS